MRLLRCVVPFALIASLTAQERPRPHLVLVFADDLGWTDLSTGRTCDGNGSPYHRTPNLDALAEQSTCFPDAYSSGPNCAPTRAALWSGQWAARTGVYTVDSGARGRAEHRRLTPADNAKVLSPEVVTLAETLAAAGYATALFGKWHLGDERDGAGPAQQGFARAVGGDHRGGVGKAGHFADEHGAFELPGLGPNGKARQFLADRLTDEAIAWLGSVDGPSFCVVSHYSVHTPIMAPDDDLAATAKPDPALRHQTRRYAAMLKNLDDAVGRLVAFLAEHDDPAWPGHKLADNTVLVFTSDNGGVGGYHAAGIDGGQEITNQLPLRSGKGALYEGGVRVPFFVRWPGVTPAGQIDRTPLQTLDLYPTFAALAGAKLPESQPIDGVDLSTRFRGHGDAPQRALLWSFPGYLEANAQRGTWRSTPVATIRRGDWKAMFWFETRSWSLFDLARDVGEARDLAAEQPEQLAPLAAELRSWLAATAAPLPRGADGAPVPLPDAPSR